MKRKSAFYLLLLTMAGCSRNEPPTQTSTQRLPVSDGALSVDAKVSSGTRFVVYCNDVWSSPQTVPVVAGEWRTYQFRVPLPLKSLRFDPTEMSGQTVKIRSVKFEYPGQPARWMPLTDLPRWLQYHAKAMFDAASGQATIQTTDKDMYVMSTVDLNIYLLQPPK